MDPLIGAVKQIGSPLIVSHKGGKFRRDLITVWGKVLLVGPVVGHGDVVVGNGNLGQGLTVVIGDV